MNHLWKYISYLGCKGEYEYNRKYPGGYLKEVPDGETCHSVCEKEEDCEAWTWDAEDKQCHLQTVIGTMESKNGSVSGLKQSCKPSKCTLYNACIITSTAFVFRWN